MRYKYTGRVPFDGWEVFSQLHTLTCPTTFQPLSLLTLLSGALFYSEAFNSHFHTLRTAFCATFAVQTFDSFFTETTFFAAARHFTHAIFTFLRLSFVSHSTFSTST
jgi:hypothetical protein